MMQRRQVGAIEADIAGSLPDTLALLREPRLALLDRHPIELKDPAGQVAVKLSLSIPLQNDVQMDDVAIRAQAHLDGVHLSALVAGRDLDQGVFDLSANPDGMKLNGRALLASIPSKLDAAMDFRRSADAGGAERDGVRAARRTATCSGRSRRDVSDERASADAGGAERTTERPRRCGSNRRSDRG